MNRNGIGNRYLAQNIGLGDSPFLVPDGSGRNGRASYRNLRLHGGSLTLLQRDEGQGKSSQFSFKNRDLRYIKRIEAFRQCKYVVADIGSP